MGMPISGNCGLRAPWTHDQHKVKLNFNLFSEKEVYQPRNNILALLLNNSPLPASLIKAQLPSCLKRNSFLKTNLINIHRKRENLILPQISEILLFIFFKLPSFCLSAENLQPDFVLFSAPSRTSSTANINYCYLMHIYLFYFFQTLNASVVYNYSAFHTCCSFHCSGRFNKAGEKKKKIH